MRLNLLLNILRGIVLLKLQTIGACNYFIWFDPPVLEQSRHVILGLLKKIKDIEGERDKVITMETIQRKFMIVLIVIMFVLFVGSKL